MQTKSPVTLAFSKLAELARPDGHGEAWLFALTWMAAARMVVVGSVPGVTSVEQLTEVDVWKSLLRTGFSAEAFDHATAHRTSAATQDISRRAAAADILAELHRELGKRPWDVLPCLFDGSARRGYDAEGTVVPELATLLMDMVGINDDSELWIPFDFRGQLTIAALRRGWSVLAASPMSAWSVTRQLLLTIEAGQPQHPKVRHDIERDVTGHPVSKAKYALVMPPFGMPVKDSRMAMWDASNGRGLEQFARSESWSIYEFVNRTNKRAVFVTPQGVLFAKGQEQRLREYLLHRGGECNEVEAVIALPPGIFGATAIAGAVLVVNPGGHTNDVYMAELGSGRRSLLEAGAIVEAGREVALSHLPRGNTRFVSRDEIAANEFSLAPSRYLRRVSDLGAGAVNLGEICISLRPPTTVKGPSPFKVAEVGMQDLNDWRPLHQSIQKMVFLKAAPKNAVLLQPGDIIFSVKGTVGKAALMGEAAHEQPVVVSQSCLALRPSDGRVMTKYLLMYLRSPHGQAQLEGLQVGAGVQHISPSTLLGSLQVPVPPLAMQKEACADFDRLCQLEDQVAQLQSEIAELTGHRWPVTVQ
jgi:hypothetical protein